jgi:hypothetical protein
MRIRLLAVLTALALLAPAAAAPAQIQNPFNGLPPAQQATPTPTATPTPDTGSDTVGRTTLYIIGGALLLTFVAIGLWIARDARRALPPEQRDATGLREDGPHRHERQAKAKARAKGRAQRQARKVRAKKAKR